MTYYLALDYRRSGPSLGGPSAGLDMGLSCGFYEGQTLARAFLGGGSATVAHAGPGSATRTDSDHIHRFHLSSFAIAWAVIYERACHTDSFRRDLVLLFSLSSPPGILAGGIEWSWWVSLSFVLLGGGEIRF